MDCYVAARCPARAYLQPRRVVGTPNEKLAVADLLEVAFQTQVRIPNAQQFGINRSMDIVADGAALPQGVMLEGVGPALVLVATEAVVIRGKQGGAATNVDVAFMRGMAGRAAQSPLRNRMMAGQVELAAHISMALEAHRLLGAWRVNLQPRPIAGVLWAAGRETKRRLRFAARFRVQAARAMAGFAPGVDRVHPRGDEPRVVRRREIAVELVVTLLALLGANVLGTRHLRKHHHGTMVDGLARHGRQHQNQGADR